MLKKKKSSKQGFSFKSMRGRELRTKAKISDHSASERLKDKRYVAQALISASKTVTQKHLRKFSGVTWRL